MRDVTADVTQGEVDGVIGRNGRRKSKLLKILSRIRRPDRGAKSYLYGRVGCLAEWATGYSQRADRTGTTSF
jgi:ABC-type polysaccharide/polyol phosphate transport system ATPase subunit